MKEQILNIEKRIENLNAKNKDVYKFLKFVTDKLKIKWIQVYYSFDEFQGGKDLYYFADDNKIYQAPDHNPEDKTELKYLKYYMYNYIINEVKSVIERRIKKIDLNEKALNKMLKILKEVEK